MINVSIFNVVKSEKKTLDVQTDDKFKKDKQM